MKGGSKYFMLFKRINPISVTRSVAGVAKAAISSFHVLQVLHVLNIAFKRIYRKGGGFAVRGASVSSWRPAEMYL